MSKAPVLQQLQLQVQAINSLVYPCLYADKGCTTVLQSKLLDQHVKVCEYRMCACSQCANVVMVKDLVSSGFGPYLICRACKLSQKVVQGFDEKLFAKIVHEECQKIKDVFNKEINELREAWNNVQATYTKLLHKEEPTKQKRKKYGVTRLARALNQWLQNKYLLDKVTCEEAANTFQLATKLEIPKKLMNHVFLLALDGLSSRKHNKFKIPFSPYKLQDKLIVMRSDTEIARLVKEQGEEDSETEEEEDDCLLVESPNSNNSNSNKKQKQ